jgi:glycosyltransferase involved in cell wall biosynthesis
MNKENWFKEDWDKAEGFPGLGRKLRILCVPSNEGGCAYYRIINPYRKLEELYPDVVEVRWNKNPLGLNTETGQFEEDWEYEDMKWADIVFTQNLCNYGANYTARIVGMAKEFDKFVHYDTDDLLTNLYEGHRLYDVYKDKGLSEITKFIYNNSDLVTVTQEKFAQRVAPFVRTKLAVIRNAIDYNLPCWNQQRVPKPKKNFCRFGWAGGIHHEQDVKYFGGVPHFVNQKVGKENCRWDFYGHPPPNTPKDDWQVDVWKRYRQIILGNMKGGKNWDIHYALPPDRYGGFYSNMDVALAPLEPNEFNDSKSEIKIAECGRYKVPLIASNVGCYDELIVNGETGFLIDPKKGRSEWVRVLSKVAKDPKLVKRMGENLHKLTEERFNLNNIVWKRLEAYRLCMEKEQNAGS